MRNHEQKCKGRRRETGTTCLICAKEFSKPANMRAHMQYCILKDEFPCDQTHNHDILERKFDSFQDAIDFVKDMGLDEGFRNDDTKKDRLYKHYRCSRHFSKTQRLREATKKVICHAKFSITEGEEGTASIKGCIRNQLFKQFLGRQNCYHEKVGNIFRVIKNVGGQIR